MLIFPWLSHWLAALLLIGMATFALLEAKSASLIPKSLFLWPLMGLLYGLMALASQISRGTPPPSKSILLVMGVAMTLCSLQALLVNIRKISRWPSGAIWLSLVLLAMVCQTPYAGAEEPVFHTFFRRLSGFVWAAIGITKVVSEKTVTQEGGIPAWIILLYVQAALIASSPH